MPQNLRIVSEEVSEEVLDEVLDEVDVVNVEDVEMEGSYLLKKKKKKKKKRVVRKHSFVFLICFGTTIINRIKKKETLPRKSQQQTTQHP